jgi:hypothetical protein
VNPVFTSIFDDVSRDPEIIRPTLIANDEVEISFELLVSADNVTLRIFEEMTGGALVKTKVLGSLGVGTHTESWDGTNDAGQIVPDEAYRFELSGLYEGHTFSYALDLDGQTFAEASAQTPNGSTWNYHRNQYVKALVGNDKHSPMRIASFLQELTPAPSDELVGLRAVARDQYRLFVADGRRASGQIVSGAASVGFHGNLGGAGAIRRNAIFVQDTAPSIFGESYSPTPPSISNVEVLSDPYVADPTYDQISTIRYTLDQSAKVWVKILKPGAPDASNPANVVAQIVTGEVQAASPVVHTVEWLGYDDSDPAATEVLQATQPGSYTFLIEAEHPTQANLKTRYRGTIQVQLAPGFTGGGG